MDTFEGPRTQPQTYKFINRTVESPGFFQYHRWIFTDWAPARADSNHVSDGYRFREIVLNPNGFAMHYGVPMAPTEPAADQAVALGLSNVAYGKPAFQRSTYRANTGAENAVDGSLGNWQYFTDGNTVASGYASGKHEYLVIDLKKNTRVEGVHVYGVHNGYWRDTLVQAAGTVVGVSTGWDAPGSPFDWENHEPDGRSVHHGHYDWSTVGTKDCWARQDCDTSPNVTRCGTITGPRPLSNQYFVDCDGAQVDLPPSKTPAFRGFLPLSLLVRSTRF